MLQSHTTGQPTALWVKDTYYYQQHDSKKPIEIKQPALKQYILLNADICRIETFPRNYMYKIYDAWFLTLVFYIPSMQACKEFL